MRMMMRSVIVYIDGFNLYHAIDRLRRPHLKWLDLHPLGTSLLREGESLKAVKYFSAYATWLPQSAARHRDYVEALAQCGTEVHMAHFKKKPRQCFSCGVRWTGHEEKETDVQIAVHMVADALRSEAERLIAVTADTDLAPAIRMIASHAPGCEVFVATPPGRLATCRVLKPRLELTAGRLAKCLLPATVPLASGREIIRPQTYDPPGNQP